MKDNVEIISKKMLTRDLPNTKFSLFESDDSEANDSLKLGASEKFTEVPN